MTPQDIWELGAEPVDFQSACLFFKAPWWAHAPDEIKRAVGERKIELKVFADITKLPPLKVKNRIGETFHGCLVIGYSHPKQKAKFTNPGTLRRQLRYLTERHLWYVLYPPDTVGVISSDSINKFQRISWEEFENHYWMQIRDLKHSHFIMSIP